MRRHGWQLPLHPLQIVGMVVFAFLVISFYIFLGPFLGNRIVENTILSAFSFTAISVLVLYIRCTWIDPSDKTSLKKNRGTKSEGHPKLNYKFIMYQIVRRFFRKMEHKILKSCIKRKYMEPWNSTAQHEPLLPFPLIVKDDAVSPYMKDEETTFCAHCDFEVKLRSKHCKTCDRCVDGFDHHCRWLNNCIGRKNYTTFILLMVFVLLMLALECGTATAIFIRYFADSKGVSKELLMKLHVEMPKGIIPAISAFLALMTLYSCAALGQLFFFHVVLIRKGMRTYDYILAMREENQLIDPFDDSDSSSDSDIDILSDDSDIDSPKKPKLLSRLLGRAKCINKNSRRLSVTIVEDSTPTNSNKKHEIRIDPMKLLRMSKEKAMMAAEKARDKMKKQESDAVVTALKPLPLETKMGPLMNQVVSYGEKFPSPRRRFSNSPSPKPQQYRSNFDLKLTQVSRELDSYISRQVLCSVLNKNEASPR